MADKGKLSQSVSDKRLPELPIDPRAQIEKPEAIDSNSKSSKPTWGPIAGVLYGFFVALLGVQLIVGVVMGVVATLMTGSTDAVAQWIETIPGQFGYMLVAEVVMVLAILGYVWYSSGKISMLGIGRLRWSHVVYAWVGVVGYYLVYMVVAGLLMGVFSGIDTEQKQNIGFENPVSVVQYLMVFVSLVILPPIAEEVVFRGFMFGGLRRKLSFVGATLITSLLFAVGHLQFGEGTPLLWIAGIDTFVLSIVLCYVREKTGSLWPAIAIHAMKNFVAFLFLYIIIL